MAEATPARRPIPAPAPASAVTPPPDIQGLFDKIGLAQKQLCSAAAGYSALQRILAAQDPDLEAPIMEWTASLNGEAVGVFTDLNALSADQAERVLPVLISLHSKQMLRAVTVLHEASAELMHVFKTEEV